MLDNEKTVLKKAMKQIKVPQEESLNALEISSNQRKNKYRKFQYKWGEIILSSVVIVCLFFIGSVMWPKAKEINKPNTLNSTELPKELTKEISPTILQSTKYWKVQGEENFYSFSKDKVRIIEYYFSLLTPRYTLKENQLDIVYDSFNEIDEPIDEIHSYQAKMEGDNLVLEPKQAEDHRLILEPYKEEIFQYTEEAIKKLKPAINPDLAAFSSWTSSIKGNRQNSTVIFDGFLMKERIDEEEKWITWTYEIKDNHFLINYGSYTVSQDMYWDGENIILWPVSNTLPKSEDRDREEYKEEIVTVMKPNK